jgi:hypothetical protein
MKNNAVDYSRLVDEAMHIIVFKVLKMVEKNGLPGLHHFFISFITNHKAVKLSTALRAKYPREMTIVLQHQYEELRVDAKGFAITLSFGGAKEQVYVPYAAITTFADPSVQFGLQFREVEYDFEELEGHTYAEEAHVSLHGIQKAKARSKGITGASNVISFDQLRKNHQTN